MDASATVQCGSGGESGTEAGAGYSIRFCGLDTRRHSAAGKAGGTSSRCCGDSNAIERSCLVLSPAERICVYIDTA